LRQILHNLIGNAVKFTDQGGVEVKVASRVEGGRARLEIRVVDTGMGIPAAMQDAVFNSFVQVDASVKRRHGGVGLGLTIAKRMVEAMGGTIRLESEEGKGSTFIVTLEFPVEESLPMQNESQLVNNLDGLAVLVVEDNPVNRLVARELLNKLGCRVELANNGAEAVEILQKTRPDVVLMDVHMPVMDGLEATQAIRRSGNRVPIFAMTASAMAADQEMCLRAGMDGFLSKPLVLQNLVETLASAVPQDAEKPLPSAA
jgi:CheY-like chemotaxis protein/anti-sigma regulatory factor (Ser/Thr protein kinase)